MNDLSLFHQEEYRRLATEIIKDRELQFRLFWQSITVTAVIFSFCATILDSELWLHYPIVILAPHLILIPTATIILNRARTVNRKSAYLMVVFDHYADSHNWERDLSILRRMDNDEQPHRIPHRAATIRDMLTSLAMVELLCIFAYFFLLFTQPQRLRDNAWYVVLVFGVIYSALYTSLFAERARYFFQTKYEDSIQGYASMWSRVLEKKPDLFNKVEEWDARRWEKGVDEDLNTGIKRFYWRLFLKKRDTSVKKGDTANTSPSLSKPPKNPFIKPKRLTPILAMYGILTLFSIGTQALRIDLSANDLRSPGQFRLIPRSLLNSVTPGPDSLHYLVYAVKKSDVRAAQDSAASAAADSGITKK